MQEMYSLCDFFIFSAGVQTSQLIFMQNGLNDVYSCKHMPFTVKISNLDPIFQKLLKFARLEEPCLARCPWLFWQYCTIGYVSNSWVSCLVLFATQK